MAETRLRRRWYSVPVLINDRTRQLVATTVELALTRQQRKRGLLGRAGIAKDAAMLLSPCLAVHTVGLGFPIDLAFVDRDGIIVRLVHSLPPWRLAGSVKARSVIELSAGRLASCQVQLGDRLLLDPAITPLRARAVKSSC